MSYKENKNLQFELGRLHGQLEAFALFNNKDNNIFTFELLCLNDGVSLEHGIREYFKNISCEVTFEAIHSWKDYLKVALREWLFAYQPQKGEDGKIIKNAPGSFYAHLNDAGNSFYFTDSCEREEYIMEFLSSVENLVEPRRALKVNVSTDCAYASRWLEVAIEGLHGKLLFRFSVSD